METAVKLTEFAHGAGCGCKIAPAALEAMIRSGNIAPSSYPALLVGNATNDDAAVMDIGNGECIISTTDFFMPIVDDAFDFGRIASANAISDVYAMGGEPLMAIAVLGWPVEKLPGELAAKVLDGARDICREAGIPLAGGHSIDSPEPFFGLAVTGKVKQSHLKTNTTAQAGDQLFLTKPLGVGILATALKRGQLEEIHYPSLIGQMARLNSVGALLGGIEGVHALTDVTGFGILGHLLEMAKGSSLNAQLFYDALPVAEGVRAYLAKRLIPDATYRNWNSYSTQVGFDKGVNVMEAFSLLPDPQTNGGLLVAVSPEAVPAVQELLKSEGLEAHTNPIGQFTALETQDKTIRVS